MKTADRQYCVGGGCTAKLGPDLLSRVLKTIDRPRDDPNLLVGFDTSDDAAVYRISDDTAIVQTLDFFPQMDADPYVFGQIAAANAMSDVYAMGGEVRTALNIVCFPQDADLNILGQIMRGGADKVAEAGGVLCGGHSINDDSIKYGLSVMGVVRPDRIYSNVGGKPGDALILTKKLGVGIICAAHGAGLDARNAFPEAAESMLTLNKRACEISKGFTVNACTDVTGFGLLGHLREMLRGELSAVIDTLGLPVFSKAYDYADQFILTAAAQRNRKHVSPHVEFCGVPFCVEEILFDPQTSGGLLLAVPEAESGALLAALMSAGLPAAKIGKIANASQRHKKEITVL